MHLLQSSGSFSALKLWRFATSRASLRPVTTTLVVIAHGTIETLADLPAFLREIRHGREPSAELIAELTERYERVGGSPLLANTQAQARALQQKTGLETRVAMRLWSPRIADVLWDKGPEDRIVLVPAAPFSVRVYEAAALRELSQLATPPLLKCIAPWGERRELLDACAAEVLRASDGLPEGSFEVILTAHSLPQFVIDRGDLYGRQFERTAELVNERIQAGFHQLGRAPARVSFCYQSQGAVDGAWLGPDLLSTMRGVRSREKKSVIVSPIGFLTEHIETLFDLDIEARNQAIGLGLQFLRVPALECHPGLITAMAQAVNDCLDGGSDASPQGV